MRDKIKIALENNDYYKHYNKPYNDIVITIADEIFQANSLKPNEYIHIGPYRTSELSFSAYPNNICSVHLHDSHRADYNNVGEYEKILISNLLFGSYYTYILAGGMGTGKTTTANYVIDYISTHIANDQGCFFKISFDFNEHILDEEQPIEKLLQEFLDELYIKLSIKTKDYLALGDDKISQFMRYLGNSLTMEKYYLFYKFRNEILGDEGFDSLTIPQKIDRLFDYIERKHELTYRVALLMKFFSFLKETLPQGAFFILLYDNLDRMPVAFQHAVLPKIFSLNQIAKIKCLVPLRRSTFKNYFGKGDQDKSSYTFGYVHHHGPIPSYIIAERIRFWKDHLFQHDLTKNVQKDYLEALKKRLDFLFEELTRPQSRLASFIDACSGRSIRLGSALVHRLIANYIIKYDDNPSNRQLWKKAMLVWGADNQMLGEIDGFVINIFRTDIDGIGYFSLLPLRIMQLVEQCKENRDAYKIGSIVEIIQSFNKWNEGEILASLNLLLHIRHPLVWTDIANKFRNPKNLGSVQEKLYMTEIGEGYLSYLIRDLTYVQECFMSVAWSRDYVPFYIDELNERQRFDALLKCLREIHVVDLNEMEKSDIWRGLFAGREIISTRIIRDAIDNVIGILKPKPNSINKRDILWNCKDLVQHVLSESAAYSKELEDTDEELTFLCNSFAHITTGDLR